MQYRIYKTLCDVIDITYPDNEKYKKFFLDIQNRELKTSHGDYNISNAHIRIFNLSRPYNSIIVTVIHEVSHHIDFCQRKETDHSRKFYDIYHNLLLGALSLGIINLEDIKNIDDSAAPTQLTRYFGDIDTWYFKKKVYKEDINIIKVKNSFNIKEILKRRGYHYSKIEQCWYIELSNLELNNETTYLKSLIEEENIQVSSSIDLKIEAIYYVIVLNSYKHRELLKKRGYIFNGYGINKNSWNKKIKANMLKDELKVLNSLDGVKVTYKQK
ncbi:hypothetical protein [Clostridium perfringens]|uniref:SprT-like domain-containing protein n=1 Tax=Clostridium perfringens E str. JGS1987 TaxID=451755 RepID=B1BRA1_CLOPF|nr:hypothetical protein [Clostridium perfringens]EDT15821.1 hypothetical protein AC3_A0232 [Clostridium perfringens E str. JGS1987]MCX0408273.1 hypothetical protein [Clostridium perfringens]MDU3019858.1 hypothetical protein [Clostridium perfringens]